MRFGGFKGCKLIAKIMVGGAYSYATYATSHQWQDAAIAGIVAYLAKKGWDNDKIGRELGMDPDEVLRFKQVTGLAELFQDREFSEAWDAA
jgi:hypothetical protein